MGKEIEDPWLVSIGYWWKKDYIDSINTLSDMIGETNKRLAQKVFDKGEIFDLYKENALFKDSNEDEEKQEKK